MKVGVRVPRRHEEDEREVPVTPTLGLHVAQVGWDAGTLSWALRAADRSGIPADTEEKKHILSHMCFGA